jgi:TRAP-type C4-dicarboxylate transport system permease large subunit
VEVTRSVLPFLFLTWGVLFLVTYVPWISLVLTRWIE